MKKTLVLLALATSSLAFAEAPAVAPQKPAQTQPAKPVEPKKSFVAAKEDAQQKPVTTEKAKILFAADQKGTMCPTDKKEMGTEKKDEQKTPAQASKSMAPKIALA